MSCFIDSCSHKTELIDYRGGSIICQECGLVIGSVYEESQYERKNNYFGLTEKEYSYVLEIIERLNLPKSVYSFIAKKILSKKDGKNTTESLMAHCIYVTLSDLGIPFSVNDVSNITGINQSKISKEKNSESSTVLIINTEDILERACSKLNLTYKEYTLIKESLTESNNGYNPSTIIAARIYCFCKKNKLNITLKQISSVTGISCMSIQRYLKKNGLSSRTKISAR